MSFTMTTFDELRDTLLTWIYNITGRDLVLANAGEGAKPRNPYVELLLSVHNSPNYQTEYLDDVGTTETVYAISTVDAELNVYGANAMQDASKLVRSLKSAQRWLDLWGICGLVNIQEMRDLSFLETGAMKQRAQVIIRLSCIFSDQFSTDYFDSVPINLVRSDDVTVDDNIPGGDNPRQKADICPL